MVFQTSRATKSTIARRSAVELQGLIDKRSDFASKCCSINSPPLYCDSEVRKFNPLFRTAQYFKNFYTQIY